MGNDKDRYGPNLMRFIDDEIETHVGATRATFLPGIASDVLSKWSKGAVPTLPTIRMVAEAMNRTVCDLVTAAGCVNHNLPINEPVRSRPISIREAIEQDPTLSPQMRGLLRGLVEALLLQQMQIAYGQSGEVTVMSASNEHRLTTPNEGYGLP